MMTTFQSYLQRCVWTWEEQFSHAERKRSTLIFPTPKQVYAVASNKILLKMRWSPKPLWIFLIINPNMFNTEENWSGKLGSYDAVMGFSDQETSSFIEPYSNNFPLKAWSQWNLYLQVTYCHGRLGSKWINTSSVCPGLYFFSLD